MEISECRVRLCDNEPVRAIASLTFDGQFVVKGIRVLHVHDRYLVCMPSRPRKDGRHQDVAHPINAVMRERINRCVMETYQAETERHARGEVSTFDEHHDEHYEEVEMPGTWVP